MTMRADRIVKIAMSAVFMVFTVNVFGAPGDLDVSFGSGGIVQSPIVNFPFGTWANAMKVQPDGKILICGHLSEPIDDEHYLSSFFIARFNPAGTLDDSFGTNGKIVLPFDFGGQIAGNDIALQPDGKIITVGSIHSFPTYGFVVHRYNPDGTPDRSFGVDGKALTSLGGYSQAATSVGVTADGKIVAAGYWYSGPSGDVGSFAVVRYNHNGSLDVSFGTGGIAITPTFGGGDIRINSLLLEPTGRIVVAGARRVSGSGSQMGAAIIRYNTDGSLDSNFGSNGEVFHMIDNNESLVQDAALQPDGKIVVGVSGNGHALVRYKTDGSIDSTFADNGIYRMKNGTGFYAGVSVIIQPDGEIVGTGYGWNGSQMGLGTVRLNSDGSPDVRFGVGGKTITLVGPSIFGRPIASAIQRDGKLLALAETRVENTTNVAILRFESDIAPHLSLAGRVMTPGGAGLRNAVVTLTDAAGNTRSTFTSTLGFYSFADIAAGELTIAASSRRYRFQPVTRTINESLFDVDLVGLE